MRKLFLLFITVLSSSEIELKQIEVYDTHKGIASQVKNQKIDTKVINSKDIDKYQIKDQKDLVRYETGVSVVENGRFGSSGYAIRGVDENRVAIIIDNLAQAQTLSSQGFKEIFEGYGNFNNIRNSPEMQNLKQAKIRKGADSITTGSGSLGGSVIFETKDARDFLIDKDWYYGFKAGFSSKDGQIFKTHNVSAKVKNFDVLFIKTNRNGHEIRNYDWKKFNEYEIGRVRKRSDPYNIQRDSTLLKISFNPTENHRLTFFNDDSKLNSKGTDFSYTLQTYKNGPNNEPLFDNQTQRHTNDTSHRVNRGFVYENYNQNFLFDSMKIGFQTQKIRNIAQTDEYCEGLQCKNVQDNGLKFSNGKITKDGHEILSSDKHRFYYKDDKGDEKDISDDIDPQKRVGDFIFDCSIFDCDLDKFESFYANGSFYGNYKKETLRQTIERLAKKDGKSFEEKKNEYVKFIKANNKKYMILNDGGPSFTQSNFIPTPSGTKGYLENQWKKRYLNTDTKQVNFDFSKFIDSEISHNVEYGLVFSKTDKTMVNYAGWNITNKKWWAPSDLPPYDINTGKFKNCENMNFSEKIIYCSPSDNPESFLIPVETKQGSLYFSDTIKPSENFAINLGYRYDHVKYKPYYKEGKHPRIPHDMVKGLFIPEEKLLPLLPETEEEIIFKKYGFTDAWWNHPDVITWDTLQTIRKEAGENKKKNEITKQKNKKIEERNKNNAIENINYISQDKVFKNHSFAIGSDIDPNENLRISLKYSKGFRVPTTDELFFAFKHPDFTIKPNTDLKPEIAYTKELAVTLYNEFGYIRTNIFQTDYKNFIDLKYFGGFISGNGLNPNAPSVQYYAYRNINRENAKIKGFEIDSKLYFNAFYDDLQNFYFGYKLTNQKGTSTDEKLGEVPLNAIQPRTQILTFGYDSQKIGIELNYTLVDAKKREQTYDMFWESYDDKDKFVKYRNGDYKVLDFLLRYSPIENFNLFGGFYNITNQKYITWDSARSIRSFGTSNMINRQTGEGIERFYSPGRNFSFSFEFKF